LKKSIVSNKYQFMPWKKSLYLYLRS
jgi:hypothetical protein